LKYELNHAILGEPKVRDRNYEPLREGNGVGNFWVLYYLVDEMYLVILTKVGK